MRRATFDKPPLFELTQGTGGHIALASDTGARAHIFVLEDDIVRILLLPDGALKQTRTWAIAPGLDDVPQAGRHRLDTSGFANPAHSLRQQGRTLILETARIRLAVDLDGFKCNWQVMDGEWKSAARDRPTQAYDFGWWDGRARHYLARESDEMIFGLGERSGEQNRAGRRFRLSNIDAMGYSARTSDPLYKHIPFTITRRPREALSYGLFYDTLADCAFDLGCELDNYHGLYRAFEADHGDLDYYFIAGPDLAAVTRRFTWLTGRPALMPAWSLGFSGSSMALADAPDAEARLATYLDQCAARSIPCPSFHLSSGYTARNGRRHVFTWNGEAFSDPARLAKVFAERGTRLAANVKPALLTDHPLFADAGARNLFIVDEDGAPALVQFWDGLGAYLDFTNPDTADWWKTRIGEALLDVGVEAIWNDNNEFEIWSPRAMAKAGRAAATRAVQPLLMTRASRQAQLERAPANRPFTVTRSGCAGMQRYAQTWSGDNATSWETLRYNLKMGLGLALCGVSNSGHDIGGFAGPPPDPELLTRWMEAGVFMPRCSIHSWNDDGSVSSPWMHEAVADRIAALIRLRFRLQPYLHYLSWSYAKYFEPIWRPTFHDFPADPATWAETDDYMLGPSLLVAPVVTPGVVKRAVCAPSGADWIDGWTGARVAGGRSVMLDAPLGRPPFLARLGAIVPVNLTPANFGESRVDPGFMLFPLDQGEMRIDLFADDGESAIDVAGSNPAIHIGARCDAAAIHVETSGLEGLSEKAFLLPPGERRRLTLA